MNNSFYEHLFGVRGKVALVTGGTRGIGLMIAEGLVRCGARVYISSRKEEACREAEEQLSKLGECIAIPCNTAHYWHKDVQKKINIPLLSMPKEVFLHTNKALFVKFYIISGYY